MARTGSFAVTSRPPLKYVVASLLAAVATCAIAQTVAPAAIPAAQTQGVAVATPGNTAKNSARQNVKPVTKPLWVELTPAQQQVLMPFAGEWDRIDATRKKKWLEIGNKLMSMKPEEQQRMQERMREWAKLTPEQRRIARESYARAKKLGSTQKSAQWEKYQQLPEEQKQKLAADATSKKHVANPPPAHSKNKTLPPIKNTPKPILEKSVTPQATHESVIQPLAPPANK